MLTIRPLVWITVLMLVGPVWAQSIQYGMSKDGGAPARATPTGMTFDPPCVFIQTLPLMAAPYLNPSTQSHFLDGEGAVLNECSNFGVSGFSPPNFLAWNCSATNLDGTRPTLPAEMTFFSPMSKVSINVGSAAQVGEKATLSVFDAAHNPIGSAASVSLTAAMQPLSVAVAGIRYAVLAGPCVMVADDVTYAP
jgi:hypothetical protein